MTAEQNARNSSRRGRKFGDRVEQVRAGLWYWLIRASGFGDYQLDMMVDGLDPSTPARGALRKRKFERTRSRCSVPGRGQAAKDALVGRVDNCRGLRGTAKTYFSDFWQLTQPWEFSLREARRLLERVLPRLGLRRLSTYASFIYMGGVKLPDGTDIKQFFGRCEYQKMILRQALEGCPIDLDLLTVVGILYKEAYLTQDLDLALVYQEELLELMEKFAARVRADLMEKLAGDRAAPQSIGRVLYEFRLLAKRGMLRGRVFDYGPANRTRDLFRVHQIRVIVRKNNPLAKFADATVKKVSPGFVHEFERLTSLDD